MRAVTVVPSQGPVEGGTVVLVSGTMGKKDSNSLAELASEMFQRTIRSTQYAQLRIGSVDSPCHPDALLLDAVIAWQSLAPGGQLLFDCPGGVNGVGNMLDFVDQVFVRVHATECLPLLDGNRVIFCDNVSIGEQVLVRKRFEPLDIAGIDPMKDLQIYASDSLAVAGLDHLRVTYNFFHDASGSSILRAWLTSLQWWENSSVELHILDIGSFEGLAASWFLLHLLSHPSSSITCALSWEEGTKFYTELMNGSAERFAYNIASFGPVQAAKVRKLDGTQFDTLSRLLENLHPLYDLIHIGGSSHGPSTLASAVLSYEMLKPGGWMLFSYFVVENTISPELAFGAFESAFAGVQKQTFPAASGRLLYTLYRKAF
jgi:hypothetical protein